MFGKKGLIGFDIQPAPTEGGIEKGIGLSIFLPAVYFG
jgi:hypothetical protein